VAVAEVDVVGGVVDTIVPPPLRVQVIGAKAGSVVTAVSVTVWVG
jgi:hypothetical protein